MKIIRNNRIKHNELLVDESIFALQNGYMGTRGNFAEGYGLNETKETLINGFYNYYDFIYEENSLAFPQKGQRIVNVIDGQTVEIYVDDQLLNLKNAELINLKRELDLSNGLYYREAHYRTKDEKEFLITENRLSSQLQKEIFIIKLGIKAINCSSKVKIVSKLSMPIPIKLERSDSRIHKPTKVQLVMSDLGMEKDFAFIKAKTTKSDLELCTTFFHNKKLIYSRTENGIKAEIEVELNYGESFELEKYLIYTASHLHKKVLENNLEIVKTYLGKDFNYYLSHQEKIISDFWQNCELTIEGNNFLDERLKYNLYQLYSSASNDYRLNIPAKGLTGEGYEGHYFWDTEIYMIPFFTITQPEIAKSLLLYRYYHLDEAKKEALNHGVNKGVKFPWRTINGNEVSPYFPAGSAQYHINADIAYAVIMYYHYTNDFQFMIDYGFELILETARFLYAIGNYSKGKFHINNITGPDEYTTLVNDNYFTNSVTKYQFEFLDNFYKKYKQELLEKSKTLAFDENEIIKFKTAAELMTLNFDDELGVFAQDSSFLTKSELDLSGIPKDKFPLLLNYHPLFIYRHQILKQADVLLSMFLLDFQDNLLLKNNFDFYLKRTTHDSSLSKCIHSIIAFRLGEIDLGTKFLNEIISMDFDNLHHNTDHGLHIANSGGIYLAIIFGVLGLRIKEDKLILKPVMLKNIKGIKTRINYRNTEIVISLSNQIEIKVSKPIQIGIYNDEVKIITTHLCDYILS